MSNPIQSPVPSVKKGSRIYLKRVKRMVNVLSGGQPMSRAERANMAHFWLEAQTFEEGRTRQRSPSERVADAEKTLKDSVKY